MTPITEFVGVILEDDQGNIALQLRGRDQRLNPDSWSIFGGHIEEGEQPLQAALREVREEAGLVDVILRFRGIIHITMPASPGVMMFVFTGTTAQLEVFASEEGTPEWHTVASLNSLPLVEDLPELLPRILSDGPLVFGHYLLDEAGLHITFD